ncbi:bifunctional riboflavin kinase/FMN phosphatase-like [Thalictrum thalictroides]|uniref:riboflavin kinase n=1 Tax=Thalictrum thalictroides TaxID=46969 RepID=A0A7J6W4J6_THATH|nr:bifunctional riboflavin kinase/FMN phosphatase-like [Thalictrum thalictroides]
MGIDAAHCLVIEDSVIGVMAAKAAGMKVVAVPSLKAQMDRYSIADYVLHSLLEFRPELWGLPAFGDWVGNALPIEPLYVKGQVQKGFLCEVADDGPNALPDQVSGIYFGWAKLSTHGIFKVVVGIGWQKDSCTTKRIIKPYLIGAVDKYISGQQLEMVLVGYSRELIHEASKMDLNVLEEDKLLASEALDLPMFAYDMNNSLVDEATLVEDKCSLE